MRRVAFKSLLLALAAVLFPLAARPQQPTLSPNASQQSQPNATPQATPPDTEIFVVNLKQGAGKWEFGEPANVTRRAGYDNQPGFLPDGQSILFTSQREGEQTDIYRYDFKTAATTRVTSTPESEYSPTVMPGGKFFSVVRVEADKTQRLWKFPLAAGGTQASLALENVRGVGYHLWLNELNLALFVLGDEKTHTPNKLQLVTLKKGTPTATEESTLRVQIGRSLQRVPGSGNFSFVHKVGANDWLIKTVDVAGHRTTTVTKTLPGSEDFAYLPDGSLLMAQDAKLFRYDPARAGGDWQQVADFTAAGLCKITRLAVSPKGDRLALVAQP